MTARTALLAKSKSHGSEAAKASSASSSKKVTKNQPPTKKRKTATKEERNTSVVPHKDATKEQKPQFKGKRKGAKLANITEMPLDILFEIFSLLHPLDLLHLARANKVIRAVVLGPNALVIWKNAFQTPEVKEHPPPPCPDSISLPQYTAMLYDQYCQVCSSRFGNMVHWRSNADQDAFGYCKSQYFHKVRTAGNYDSGNLVSKIEYESRRQQIKDLRDAGESAQAEKLSNRWAVEASSPYVNTSKWRTWQYNLRHLGMKTRERRRLMRRNALDTKIRAEGYTHSEVNWYGRTALPAYRKAVDLTDKEWEKIKDETLAVFAYRRQQGVRHATSQRYSTSVYQFQRHLKKLYLDAIPDPFIIPTVADMAKSEPFRTLIDNASNTLSEEQVQEHKHHITPIIDSWKESAKQQLIELLPVPLKRSKLADEDKLCLATTFFKCHWCTEPISYPRVLMHSCLRDRRIDIKQETDDEDESQHGDDEDESEDNDDLETEGNASKKPRVFIDSSPETMWNIMSEWFGGQWNEGGEQVTFDEEASRVAHNILLACGRSTESTTMSMMDEANLRVECMRCASTSIRPQRLIMTWKMAIVHDMERHFEEELTPTGWKVVDDEDVLQKVRDKEDKQNKTKNRHHICKLCLGPTEESYFQIHMRNVHNVHQSLPSNTQHAEPEFIRRNFILHPDQSIKFPALPVRLPL
ncbi:hypothetical protein CVT24_006206 [Panaeolus cyanescens]|uniref:F-box domain-containing protein n=1 Tax=Panaeolus cyanescens TaxID=181874 RepID=A0A409VZX1_9AGAR|nr:hypothetical protein CVT24_006206 [Panaeolus cyanescens]